MKRREVKSKGEKERYSHLNAGFQRIARRDKKALLRDQCKEIDEKGCILSPCLLKLYAVYTMRNTGLNEAQAGIKTARRNINNLRYADDTTLISESEELKSLLMKVKEENEKVGLKLNIQ